MRTLRLYLETTIWNFLATEREEKNPGPVTELYREISLMRYKMYISPLVIVEIERTKEERRRNMLKNLIEEYKPELLEDIPEIGELANQLLHEKLVVAGFSLRLDAITFLILRLIFLLLI